jgi:hypothetical protein
VSAVAGLRHGVLYRRDVRYVEIFIDIYTQEFVEARSQIWPRQKERDEAEKFVGSIFSPGPTLEILLELSWMSCVYTKSSTERWEERPQKWAVDKIRSE